MANPGPKAIPGSLLSRDFRWPQALREDDATFLLALLTAPFTFAMAVFVTLDTLVLFLPGMMGR